MLITLLLIYLLSASACLIFTLTLRDSILSGRYDEAITRAGMKPEMVEVVIGEAMEVSLLPILNTLLGVGALTALILSEIALFRDKGDN